MKVACVTPTLSELAYKCDTLLSELSLLLIRKLFPCFRTFLEMRLTVLFLIASKWFFCSIFFLRGPLTLFYLVGGIGGRGGIEMGSANTQSTNGAARTSFLCTQYS